MLSLLPPIRGVLFRPKLHPRRLKPVVSSFSSKQRGPPPPPPPGSDLYQPFRPPPFPLPDKYRSLDPGQILDILRNRLGLWHEYAPLISSLTSNGFTPAAIEDITGISSLEQNRIAVACRVRDSLSLSAPDLLPLFDHASSSDLLYELRLLNNEQRTSAARYALDHNLDSKAAQDLSRAIRDFPKRRGDRGWDSFSSESPADCLAFTHFRVGLEAIPVAERAAALEKALETAETENAKEEIERARGGEAGGNGVEDEVEALVKLSVVRLRYGEVAEATSVVLLPVAREGDGVEGVRNAPRFVRRESGDLGVVEAEREWKRWVVLPGWAPLLGIGGEGGVAVEFRNATVLPRRLRRWKDEGVVLVVDRKKGEVQAAGAEEGFYLVSGGGEEMGMMMVRGREVGEKEVLGAVVMVVRPPREDEDQLSEEDWD